MQSDFERKFKELKDVVQKIEDPDVEMEEAIKLYEHGTRLVEQCDSILKEVEMKITKLS